MKKEVKEYNVIPDVLTIRSNVNDIHYFSFAEHLDNATQKRGKIIVDFIIDDTIKKPENLSQKFHFFWGEENVRKIYYERPLFLNKVAKLLFEETDEGFRLRVNKDYYNLVRLKMDNVFPPGVHLTDIAVYTLIKNNFLPIHAAAISRNECTSILFAPPDTGKSLTTVTALKNGYEFISEDIAVIDKKYIYACPFTYTYLHANKSRRLNLDILTYFFRDSKPKSSLANYGIKAVSVPKNIFILNRGTDTIERISKPDALKQIALLNKAEFNYIKNPLIIALEYFNRNSINTQAVISTEEQLLKNLVMNVDIFMVKTNYPKKYITLIENVLNIRNTKPNNVINGD